MLIGIVSPAEIAPCRSLFLHAVICSGHVIGVSSRDGVFVTGIADFDIPQILFWRILLIFGLGCIQIFVVICGYSDTRKYLNKVLSKVPPNKGTVKMLNIQ